MGLIYFNSSVNRVGDLTLPVCVDWVLTPVLAWILQAVQKASTAVLGCWIH